MRRKAISTIIMTFIFTMVTIGMLLVTYLVFVGKFLDIRAMLESVEVERNNVIFTQILISSDKLAYSDSKVYRGLLDKNKLDEEMKEGSETVKNTIAKNTVAVMEVKDLVTQTKWQTIAYDENSIKDLKKNEFDSCLKNSNFKIEACLPSSATSVGSSVKTYPTAIRVSEEEVHLGRITVSTMELKV